MLEALKKLLGVTEIDYKKLLDEGAIIVDVRSAGEYASGHVEGSINIPLDQLDKRLNELTDKQKPVLTCCASGMRSGMAKKTLTKAGFEIVHNAGGWVSLQNKLQH